MRCLGKLGKICFLYRFFEQIKGEFAFYNGNNGEATAIDGNAITELDSFDPSPGTDSTGSSSEPKTEGP